MFNQQGEISVTTQHIFPIIKRWLYSDKDIFLREIVSNASDAITKLARLSSLGEAETAETGRIEVVLNKAERTLTVRDNGIGMTADEVERYLNQIALSGALEFIEKYEGEGGGADGIIGHFGLGFYSAFMVAGKVEVLTRSYTNAPAVHWICTDAGAFEMGEGEREGVGTDVILHVTEEESAYLEREKCLAILEKYCSFLAYPIYLSVVGEENGEEKSVNDTEPLWMKPSAEVSEDEYRAFYHKLFGYNSEPLFWVHINADYPLNFKGILYFPRLGHKFESMEGEVKLFYNRVFVADNISEVVPEYLLALKGVLDCPELPLNVSRSFLQNSPYVSKLSAHIAKKVADKLMELFRSDRARFEGFSEDLRPFLEYGAIKDNKFFTRIRACLLFADTEGQYLSMEEYLEGKESKKVYYTTDPVRQAQYVKLIEGEGERGLVLREVLDAPYISF
ncbi:MAG: molecular chaperone HtpG, partial [Clostridia bacterium]|nr:molecular chaperone HtpG [Clostridia bacterium]